MQLLLFGAEVDEVAGADVLDSETVQAGDVGEGYFLHGDHREATVEAQATIAFRGGGVEHPQFAGFPPDLARDAAVLFPLLVEGHALIGQEAADGTAKLFVVVIKQGAGDHGDAVLWRRMEQARPEGRTAAPYHR
ncbi:hypothetical protein D9M69_576260 [compost metagenome]